MGRSQLHIMLTQDKNLSPSPFFSLDTLNSLSKDLNLPMTRLSLTLGHDAQT